MVLPIEAIEATIDVPGLIEIKPGQKTIRIVYRATLKNTGDETRVLHTPSTDHSHFWHLFDEDLNELDRERGKGKGGEKDASKPIRFRGLTLAAGQEIHDSHTIRVDADKVLAGSGRYVLRVDLWGQTAEAEFHTVVRPVRLTPAKKRPAKKKAAPKKRPAKRVAAKKTTAKKRPAKKKTVRKKPARRAAKRK